ncbi:MAG: hypothetical protein WD077_10405 [Bacteroidia bacterium]
MPVTFSKSQAIKYLKQKSRSLPVHDCLVTANWPETGLATCLISRQMPGGNFIFAIFLLDTFCLGVKNAMYNLNLIPRDYKEMKERVIQQSGGKIIEVDIHYFHNLVYGAVDFAEIYGFKPHKDFAIAEYLLDPDLITEGIDELEFGLSGKPHYIRGPHESDADVKRILKTLERTAGKANFTKTITD